ARARGVVSGFVLSVDARGPPARLTGFRVCAGGATNRPGALAALGGPAARCAGRRLARDGAPACGRAQGGRRGRAGVLDELRRAASRESAALDGAVRPRGNARVWGGGPSRAGG